MRQLIALVPRGQGNAALDVAASNGGSNLACFPAEGADGAWDVVLIHAPNSQVEGLLDELERIENLHVNLAPQEIITLRPPAEEAPDQVTDVTLRSPIEIFLGGLQSIGSWGGFLGYAVAAGIVAWIGLYTNTIYLLTASMLIAPFAGPAMTLALGTARGDRELVARSLLRYLASLAVSIAVAALLSLVLRQETATELMVATSTVSSVALLLPLTAGAAGALHLCQSERTSLVTAAGAGMLVAASLAPPAGVVGMAATLRDWDMVKSGAFVLLLQLVGINLSGAAVFWLFGLGPKGARFRRGRGWVRWAALAVTAAALIAVLTWQFSQQPNLQRSTRSQRIAADVQTIVKESRLAHLVEANVRFTRSNIPGQNSVLILAYVQRREDVDATDQAIRQTLAKEIRRRIRQKDYNVTPLVDVTVLEG